MATAEELLRSTMLQPDPEGHIVVGGDRFITIPDNLKRLGVQFDHNMETITFDCPRYWDDRDMSKMAVYINYALSNNYMDRYPADNVRADGDIMHFDWTISRNVTQVSGQVSFLICVMKTDGDGNEERHWNSELCQDAYVSPGMEAEGHLVETDPDLVTQLLLRMASVEQINVQANEMQTLYENTVAVAETAEETKNQALDASNYIKNSYANAVKGYVSDKAIRVDDVSPIEHQVKCSVHGKNLFGFTGRVVSDFGGYGPDVSRVFIGNAIYTGISASNYYDPDKCTYSYDAETGQINVTTDKAWYGIGIDIRVKPNTTYFVSGDIPDTCFVSISQFAADGQNIKYEHCNNNTFTTAANADWVLAILSCKITDVTYSFSNIQLEEGTTVTEYEPYINPTGVTLTSCGVNLIPYPYAMTTRTIEGVTYTVNDNGSVTVNGTATANSIFYLAQAQTTSLYLPEGVYRVSGCPGGGSNTTYRITIKTDDDIPEYYHDIGNGGTFTLAAAKRIYVYICVGPNTTVNNLNFYPQLEINNITTNFEFPVGEKLSPSSDGTCTLTSKSLTMTLFTDTPGVIIEAEYNVDTKIWFENRIMEILRQNNLLE